MPLKFESPHLHCFWIAFEWPSHPQGSIVTDSLPRGFGVTAFSKDDAIVLLKEDGLDRYYHSAMRIDWTEVTDLSQLENTIFGKHVFPNSSPLFFRGIWYPSLNLGFGASGQKKSSEADGTDPSTSSG